MKERESWTGSGAKHKRDNTRYAREVDPQDRYPDLLMPFAPSLPASWAEFADAREALLLDYGYNTARAYWADLQDWFEWAIGIEKNVLRLTEADRSRYVALLRRRKYSESTIRRRLIALKLLYGESKPRDEGPRE